MNLKIKKLHPDAVVPTYATPGAACFDLHALTPEPQSSNIVRLANPKVFRTGLSFEIPAGHVMLIFSRSGHGFKHETRLSNCVGVIDSDYRGEVMVKLTNDAQDGAPLIVSDGDRIAQAMILPVQQVTFEEVTELSATERGEGGFGSTGA